MPSVHHTDYTADYRTKVCSSLVDTGTSLHESFAWGGREAEDRRRGEEDGGESLHGHRAVLVSDLVSQAIRKGLRRSFS